MLKEILKKLRDGEELVLDWYENAFAEAVDTALIFENGTWEVKQLNCISASAQGLGTCACNSHPTYTYEQVSREQALEIIKNHIKKIQQEEERKQKEIEFLDNLINSL